MIFDLGLGRLFLNGGKVASPLRLVPLEPQIYAYRVVLTGINLLRTGEVQANIVELNRAFQLPFMGELIAKKQAREHGGLSGLDYEWHRAELARWEDRLGEAYEQSKLPDEPPRDDVHAFLVKLRLPDGSPLRA